MYKTLAEITPAEQFALMKTLADAFDPTIPVGNHPINLQMALEIDVQGTIRKSADEEYTPTISIPITLALALVLEKAGFQRENAKALLISAMTEALTLDPKEKANEHIAQRLKDIETAMTHVQQITSALPKQSRKGKTFPKLHGIVSDRLEDPDGNFNPMADMVPIGKD